jgi:hypothetical protein
MEALVEGAWHQIVVDRVLLAVRIEFVLDFVVLAQKHVSLALPVAVVNLEVA